MSLDRYRNHAEITRRRQELQGELNAETADVWITSKAQLKDFYWKHYEDLDTRLADPDLDDRVAVRLTREVVSILHKLSELMGWLPARTAVEVDAPRFMSEEPAGISTSGRTRWRPGNVIISPSLVDRLLLLPLLSPPSRLVHGLRHLLYVTLNPL